MKNEPIVVEATYIAPVDRVWKAITSKDEMKQWYFDVSAFKPEPGFEFEFTATNDNIVYVHKSKVTEVLKEKKLTYSWRYEGHEGNSYVTFELFPEGNKTKLKLTHEGVETFPQNKPDFAKASFQKGWETIIGTSLKNYLEKVV